MDDQPKPASRPRRRFLRLSVRGLIVVVVVIGVWLGCIVRTRVQRDAVVAIENAGGAASYDWDRISGNIPVGKPWRQIGSWLSLVSTILVTSLKPRLRRARP